MADKYVHKISSRYLQKWLRYDIKHVKNGGLLYFHSVFHRSSYLANMEDFRFFLEIFLLSWSLVCLVGVKCCLLFMYMLGRSTFSAVFLVFFSTKC